MFPRDDSGGDCMTCLKWTTRAARTLSQTDGMLKVPFAMRRSIPGQRIEDMGLGSGKRRIQDHVILEMLCSLRSRDKLCTSRGRPKLGHDNGAGLS
jgi:hypothetical protein